MQTDLFLQKHATSKCEWSNSQLRSAPRRPRETHTWEHSLGVETSKNTFPTFCSNTCWNRVAILSTKVPVGLKCKQESGCKFWSLGYKGDGTRVQALRLRKMVWRFRGWLDITSPSFYQFTWRWIVCDSTCKRTSGSFHPRWAQW